MSDHLLSRPVGHAVLPQVRPATFSHVPQRRRQTPDVRDVMSHSRRLQLENGMPPLGSTLKRVALTTWPSPEHARAPPPTANAPQRGDKGPTPSRQGHPLELATRLQRLVDSGFEALRAHYPQVQIATPQQLVRPVDVSDNDCDESSDADNRSPTSRPTTTTMDPGSMLSSFQSPPAVALLHAEVDTLGRRRESHLLRSRGASRRKSSVSVAPSLRSVGGETEAPSESPSGADLEQAVAEGRLAVFQKALHVLCRRMRPYRHFFAALDEELEFYVSAARRAADERLATLQALRAESTVHRTDLESTVEGLRGALKEATESKLRLESQTQKHEALDRQKDRTIATLEATVAEQTAQLQRVEESNAIHSRRLKAAELRVEELQSELADRAMHVSRLERQFAGRQLLVDHLNQGSQVLREEKAVLQKQVVLAGNRGALAAATDSTASTVSVATTLLRYAEQFFQVQLRHSEALAMLELQAIESLSPVPPPHASPRESPTLPKQPGRPLPFSPNGTDAAQLERRLRHSMDALHEANETIQRAREVHEPTTVARLTVPGHLNEVDEELWPSSHYFLVGGPRWFVGMGGENDGVPVHLAASGRILNLRMPRKAALQHASKFLRWLGKSQRRSDVFRGADLSAAFAAWSVTVFPADQVASLSYSFHYAARAFSYDATMAFMAEGLAGRTHSAVALAIEDSLQRVQDALEAEGQDNGGVFPKSHVVHYLKGVLSTFDDDDADRICAAIDAAFRGDRLNVLSLFSDARGEPLIRQLLREAYYQDRGTMLRDLTAAVLDQGATDDGTVTPHVFVNAFLQVDPHRPHSRIEELMHILFVERLCVAAPISGDDSLPLESRYTACTGAKAPLKRLFEELARMPLGRWTKRRTALKLHDDVVAVRAAAASAKVRDLASSFSTTAARTA